MSGFDHRAPEIEALMEARSREQGERLELDHPHELVFNQFEMRRREAAMVDPLGVDDVEPWIPSAQWEIRRGGLVRFNPSSDDGRLQFREITADTSQVLAALQRAADATEAFLRRFASMDPEPG